VSTELPPGVAAVADQVLGWVLDRSATLGAGRLVCVDGPAGSGKSTLGAALQRAAGSRTGTAALVHMDDLYPGWSGLEAAVAAVAEDLVGPLRSGRAGCYRRYDWVTQAPAERRVVDPVDLLVLEGVGSSAAAPDAATCLVWVEAPEAERLRRGLARDGEAVREHWLAWMRAEQALFARDRTRDRADFVVDGTGTEAPVVRTPR
jgi:uridine kinase